MQKNKVNNITNIESVLDRKFKGKAFKLGNIVSRIVNPKEHNWDFKVYNIESQDFSIISTSETLPEDNELVNLVLVKKDLNSAQQKRLDEFVQSNKGITVQISNE